MAKAMRNDKKKENETNIMVNHKYSTIALLTLIILLFIGSIVALTSEDIDEVCTTEGSILKRINGSWQCATDLNDNVSVGGNGTGLLNNTDAIFNNLNVTGNLTATLNCDSIVGGNDTDFCSDALGSGTSGSTTVDDDWINTTGDTLLGDLTLPDEVKIKSPNGQQIYFKDGDMYFVI